MDGRGLGNEGGRLILGRRGGIVPDSEMEFTSSALGEAKFVDSRPNGWACV